MKERIYSALTEWNPWLSGTFPDELSGIPREYDTLSYLEIPEIKILEGVRRSGKSTLLYQVAKQGITLNKQVLYINFDDQKLKRYSLEEIVDAFHAYQAQVDYLLVDEVQQCGDWVPFLRKLYDQKACDQMWITGSNSSLIKQEYAELLTGRNLKIHVVPLSFREFLLFRGLSIPTTPLSKKESVEIIHQFEYFIKFGAFPAIALRNVHQQALLVNYFEDFLFKDIATRHKIDTMKLRDLAHYMATHSTKLISFRKVADALSLHPSTVTDYVNYMRDVFLFDELTKFDFSLKAQYRQEKKLMAIDTGLANAVSFRFSEDKGRMLETLVYRHLKRLGHEVYFHRGKKECDFICKQGLDITHAIQVTLTMSDENTRAREIAGLMDASNAFNPRHNWIITLDEEETLTHEGRTLHIMPAWKWMLGISHV